jgi:hypothetical protein
MTKWGVSGLIALVLSSGCSGIHEPVQPAQPIQPTQTIESAVASNETLKRRKYKEAKNLCYVANALYKASANELAMKYYREARRNIENYNLPVKGNPDFALAYNRMAEYYAFIDIELAEKYAEIAFKNYPDNKLFEATLEMIRREINKFFANSI